MRAIELERFLTAYPLAVVAELTRVRGSSPRAQGTFMVIAAEALIGTIGGGALEYMVIGRARQALRDDEEPEGLDIPLGPEIGQCCGGRVELSIRHVDAALRGELVAMATSEDAAHPHVYLFGGGHVGHALASALSLLPLKVTIVETRADALEGMPDAVTTRLTPVPEEAVRAALHDDLVVPGGDGGVIAAAADGTLVLAYCSDAMLRAHLTADGPVVVA